MISHISISSYLVSIPFFHSNKNKDLAKSPIVHLGFSRQDVEDRIDESRNKRGKILEESMDGDSKFGTSLNYREGIVVGGGVFGRDGNVSSQLKVKVERMSSNISDDSEEGGCLSGK